MIDVSQIVDELFKGHWRWLHAKQWTDNGELRHPGVYLLAYDARELEGQGVKVDDVYYVGMSNSAGGVVARLKQFKSALENGYGHSGAKHFYTQNNKTPFSKLNTTKKFYFTAWSLKCESSKSIAQPDDFRKMGAVARLEYYLIAYILAKSAARKVPQLNHSAGGVLMES